VSALSPDLLARAFRAGNGEVAWTREDAARATDALADAGLAILGGEVWLVGDGGWWDARIPTADGDAAVHSWAPDPPVRQDSESWAEFCARTRDYTAVVLAAAELDAIVPPALRERLRYHLTRVSEEAYGQLARRNASPRD
jgi:hypothetical protein